MSDRFKNWMLAFRPKTLPAAVGPVAVGAAAAFADGSFHASAVLCALAGALFLQVGVNLANDYFDFKKGVDTQERLGPVRVTQSGLIAPGKVFAAMVIALMFAALFGVYLIYRGGWPVVAIGTASIISAVAYSGGPYPLASHGLGDLFVFIFFGPVAVCGTYYVQALEINTLVLIFSLPPGLLITAILIVNNLRDIGTDSKVGKRTMAVILGESGACAEYFVLFSVSYLIPVALWGTHAFSLFILLPLITLPMGAGLMKKVAITRGRELNPILGQTAMFSLVFSLLFSVGVVLQG